MTAQPQTRFTIEPAGAFSLRESVQFGFGQREAEEFDGVMRLAFCLDDFSGQVGVELRQDADGVHGVVHGSAETDLVRAQVARVLSLDVDAVEYDRVGERDPVIAELQRVAHGLRPPLFYSPYEAAVWSVLSARRPAAQMAAVREAMSRAHGKAVTVAGRTLGALPTPTRLLGVTTVPGLTPEKILRMHGVARAALDGQLDVAKLRRLGPVVAQSELQRIKGIGPFYASLIAIRSVGFTDVLATEEPRVRSAAARLYRLPGEQCSPEQFAEIAEAWRPFRTWCSVLLRAASGRVGAP